MSSSDLPSLIASSLRAGHPDFLDLPWHRPLDQWEGHTDRLVDLPRGLSRHPVVFVQYEPYVYALKQLQPGAADKEYALLRAMEDLKLPVVVPVGHSSARTDRGEVSVLLTRYLEHALPYHSLFMRSSLTRYRDHLLDAMALLLVQLHLAGVFWGDCSLNNTLFRRDAGKLTAYLVDAETAEVHPTVSSGMRAHDLDIMEENVQGGLLDLDALGALPEGVDVRGVGAYIRRTYGELWEQVTSEQLIPSGERYRIQDRVRRLNELGFSVDEIVLEPSDAGANLRLRAQVTDRLFHRNMMHSLTGLDPEEMQARTMLNEIQEVKAALSNQQRHSMTLSAAAHRWLRELYLPTVDRLRPLVERGVEPAELYCQLLEHKWYLSERATNDVGHVAAAHDLLTRGLGRPSDPGERP
jgi:Domain of unknown function (DUF4032)/Lipopolysaccharide kinase (Kdo/WaaP) family